MKLIQPNFEIIPQEDNIEGIYKLIEIAGRTCYKSEDKITETSAKEFVDRMIKSGHGAMLEHGTIYLEMPHEDWKNLTDIPENIDKYYENNYSKLIFNKSIKYKNNTMSYFITTNFRVLVENNWLDDLKYLCEPTKYHEKRITVNFNAISIGIAREFTRHRVFSFAQQSTRYCNYSKTEKFGNDLQFIKPSWSTLPYGEYTEDEECKVWCPNDLEYYDFPLKERCLLSSLLDADLDYKTMIIEGCKAQEAREILPLALNAPLIMTGFVNDWQHFFQLRCDTSAHPDARAVAIPLQEEFKKLKLI